MTVDERDDADAHHLLAGRTALATPGEDAEVEDGEDGPGQEGFVLAGGDGKGFAGADLVADEDANYEEDDSLDDGQADDGGVGEADVDDEGGCAGAEAGELDTIELEEPFGFTGREVAHGSIVRQGAAFAMLTEESTRRVHGG